MGEIVRISDYLDRRASETDPHELTKRLAQIACEILTLQSEKNRIEALLFDDPVHKS